jgi:hypothetical protein
MRVCAQSSQRSTCAAAMPSGGSRICVAPSTPAPAGGFMLIRDMSGQTGEPK